MHHHNSASYDYDGSLFEICPGLNSATRITKTAKIRKGTKNGLKDVRGTQRELRNLRKLRELRELRKFARSQRDPTRFTQRYQEWLVNICRLNKGICHNVYLRTLIKSEGCKHNNRSTTDKKPNKSSICLGYFLRSL